MGVRTKREPRGSHRPQQRQLVYRGRAFHFVSYEGQPENVKKGVPASGPAWYLMNSGTRWEVMPFSPAQEETEVDQQLLDWVKRTIN